MITINQTNLVVQFITILFLTIALQSCESFREIEDPISRSSTYDYVKFRNEKLNELESFVGKSKQDVLNIFGEPGSITRFDSVEVPYSEMWSYKYSKNIPFFYYNEYGIIFYFIEEKIVKVDVL